MSEQLPFQPIEPEAFQPPTLEQRAPDAVQYELGDPVAEGWAVQAPPNDTFSRLEQRWVEYNRQQNERAGMLSRIRSRFQKAREFYADIPERTKDNAQLGAMVGAAAVLSTGILYHYAEKYGGVGDQAVVAGGLYALAGASAYKIRKYGLPGAGVRPSKKNRR